MYNLDLKNEIILVNFRAEKERNQSLVRNFENIQCRQTHHLKYVLENVQFIFDNVIIQEKIFQDKNQLQQ